MSDSVVYRITIDPSGAITGSRQVEGGLEGVQNQAQNTGRSFDNVGTKAVALGALAVAAFNRISSTIRQTITESINLARRQEEAEARVASLVRTTGQAAGFSARELRNMASEMQGLTRFGDEAILEAQAKLLTFRSVAEDNFRGALVAAMDLAEAGFGSLEQNIRQLGRALEDPVQGLAALRRSGVSFSEAQQETIRGLVESNQLYEAQALILETIQAQVGGTAEAMSRTASGAVDQLNNAIGDLRETLGATILQGFAPYARTLLQVVDAVNSYLSTPFSRELQEEQVTVNRLVAQIRDQNRSNEDRVRLLRELEQIQPELVRNLRDETLTNEELAEALREVNRQYTERIILQSQEEEIQAAAVRVGRALQTQAVREIALRERLIELAKQEGFAMDEFVTKSLEEQTFAVRRALNAKTTYVQGVRVLDADLNALNRVVRSYENALSGVQNEEERAAELAARHAEIRDILGISFEESGRAAGRTAEIVRAAITEEMELLDEYVDIYQLSIDTILRDFERASQQMSAETQALADRRHDIDMAYLDQAKDVRRKDLDNFRATEQAKQNALAASELMFGQAMGRAAAQQLEYADSFKSAMRGVIQALLSEVIALSIRNAVISGGLNPLAAAIFGPIAAASARAAFNSLVPRFAVGGWPGQRQRGQVRGAGTGTSDSIPALLSRGEHVMNAASAAQMRETLNIANASPQAARTINEIVTNRTIMNESVNGGGEMVVRVTGRIEGENIRLANERSAAGIQRSDLEVF